MGDKLDSYRQGRDARRGGVPSTGSPEHGREEWEAGWWDEEAFATQREAMRVLAEEAAAYRRGSATCSGACPTCRRCNRRRRR